MEGGERKYYDGPSAPPAVIIRFLQHYGFRLESRYQQLRCCFYPGSRRFETRFAPEVDERVQQYPLYLPQPQKGQLAIAGGTIDMNVFVNAIERGLLPPPEEALNVWNAVYDEVMADENARSYCLTA